MLKIKIPASTGNVGSGFDVLGLAAEFYLEVEIHRTETGKCETEFSGEGSSVIDETNNLIESSLVKALRDKKVENPGCLLKVFNQIPIERGMGSSGTAVIAGALAANYIGNLGLSKDEQLSLAVNLEGHPDNVNSSFTGGLTSSLSMEDGTTLYRKCDFPKEIDLVYAIPEYTVSTEKARKALPQSYSMQDVIFNMQRIALVFEAVRSSDFDLLSHVLQDRIHQPYRSQLVPGMYEILKFTPGNGLISTLISGSGPTALAMTHSNGDEFGERMKDTFAKHGISSRILMLKADNTGIRTDQND